MPQIIRIKTIDVSNGVEVSKVTINRYDIETVWSEWTGILMKNKNESDASINRRRFMMAGAGAVAGTMALPEEAEASHSWGRGKTVAEPKPIEGKLPIGLPAPLDEIRWFAAGKAGVTLPFSGIPLFGKQYEPNTIDDFYGNIAYGYLAGEAKGSDGEKYNVELDLRVYDGKYVATNGEVNYATFALI